MQMYDDLISQLRATKSRSKRQLLDRAAAAIERLQAEVQRTQAEPCEGCVHEQTNKGTFPCDECGRMRKGEYDMFVRKVRD